MTEATYQDEHLTIYAGDCRAVLASLPAESVHAVVTSPPYYGLRDYGVAATSWGGDPEHAHEWAAYEVVGQTGGTGASTLGAASGGHGISADGVARSQARQAHGGSSAAWCACGAWLGVLGLEPDPLLYVENLVEVFREVRRVLRRDGTVWLNLGDSYASKSRGSDRGWDKSRLTNPGYSQKAQGAALRRTGERHRGKAAGFKSKDRMMIPARVAIALQADGWWLRDEIVWSKPNPMPSSVEDRTTPAHEMVYLLARAERYQYDGDAIREQRPAAELARQARGYRLQDSVQHHPDARPPGTAPHTGLHRASWPGGKQGELAAGPGSSARTMPGFNERWRESQSPRTHGEGRLPPDDVGRDGGRNRRSVWTVATEPYPEAHFATFPERLIEPMITASVAPHVCPSCGAPWTRTTTRDVPTDPGRSGESKLRDAVGLSGSATSSAQRRLGQGYQDQLDRATTTYGPWLPGCDHEAPSTGGVVLDPFGGSGTVAVVAQRLGRRAVLVDLSPEYVEQMVRRIAAGRSAGEGPAVDMPVPFAADGLWGDA